MSCYVDCVRLCLFVRAKKFADNIVCTLGVCLSVGVVESFRPLFSLGRPMLSDCDPGASPSACHFVFCGSGWYCFVRHNFILPYARLANLCLNFTVKLHDISFLMNDFNLLRIRLGVWCIPHFFTAPRYFRNSSWVMKLGVCGAGHLLKWYFNFLVHIFTSYGQPLADQLSLGDGLPDPTGEMSFKDVEEVYLFTGLIQLLITWKQKVVNWIK